MADGFPTVGSGARKGESGSIGGHMTDHTETPAPRSGGRLDPLQILFWFSVAVGLGAAGVALTAGQAVGQAGAVLLILLAAAGLVLFFWMSRGVGRRVGAFPERGAIAATSLLGGRDEFAFVAALDEAALITDAHLSPGNKIFTFYLTAYFCFADGVAKAIFSMCIAMFVTAGAC